MAKRISAGLAWLLLVCATLLFAPADASALTYYWGRHPDKERLVLVFPDTIPEYSVTRTGKTTLRVLLPEDYWSTDAKPQPANFASAKLLKRVKILRDGLEIQVRSPAFGYIQFPLAKRGKLVVDVFSDPIGARWKASGGAAPQSATKKSAPPVPQPPQPKQSKQSQPAFKAKLTPEPTVQQPVAKPAQSVPAPEKSPEPAGQPAKGNVKPAPEVRAAVKPAPKPGVGGEAKPAVPARRMEEKTPATPAPGAAREQGKAVGKEPAEPQAPAVQGAVPPPLIELPKEEPKARASSGQAKQPFYTVPYSYRAPIIKDKAPLHTDPSSKGSPQPAEPQAPGQGMPESEPHSSLFLDFPVGTAIAAEIHPPPQQLVAQNQATEPEKNTFTVRQRIAPPPDSSGKPGAPAEPQKPGPSESRQQQQPPAAPAPAATPQPPNPVPETTAYMERETPPKAGQPQTTQSAPAAPATPEAEKKPYSLRGKIRRPGDASPAPASTASPSPEPAAPPQASQTPAEPPAAPKAPASSGPAMSRKITRPGASTQQSPPPSPPPSPQQAPQQAAEPAPAQAVPAPGTPPAMGVPWSGEQQLSMPLSSGSAVEPAPEPAPEPPAASTTTPVAEPQRIPPPVVRTTPSPAREKSESAPAAPAPADPAQEAEAPADAASSEEQAATEAKPESKLPTDEEMQELDNPYKTARQEQAKEGDAVDPENQLPDFPQILLTGKAAMANEDYQNAYDVFEGLKKDARLPAKMRKEILYLDADALYSLSQNNMDENFSKVMSAYTEALNYDPESIKASQALYHMGVANLKVGNAREAEAYFNILKDKYPDDPQIPMIYYQWGQYYFERNEFRKAADEFQYVVQKYPDNKVALPASVFLARSLNELGLDEAAYKIVDYVQKRWPRYYTQYPPVLKLMGDVFYRMGELERAKASYWTYYNLDPKGDEADVILARLGDIYLQTGHKETAVDVYNQTVADFPNKEGGLVARMRLAEQGVYDKPTVQQMFSIFDRPYSLKPSQVYTMIVDKFPDSPLAPLAQIKLAMWHLWNKEYKAAINDVNAFQQKFPDDNLLDSAREVGTKAFDKLLDLYIPEENYQAAVAVWNESPLLRANEENLSPKARVELATCFWKQGQPEQSKQLLDPFFLSAAMPEQAQNALLLALNIALQQRDWKRILDLGNKVELWDLDPKTRYELDYNMALAYENEGETDKSALLWQKLADTGDADPKQEAYILYFMAQNARDKGEYKKAYNLAQQSLDYFLEHRTDQQKIKDLLALLIDITDTAGRTREALKWAIEYSRYVNRKDPDWPALRYRMAQLYKKLADMRKWRSILEELITTMPESLYGRMARSDLNSQNLEQKAQQFVPTGNL